MREYIINDPLGKLIVTLPNTCCAFCSHCTDVFYDYSNGPYLYLCGLDNKTTSFGTCAEFENIEGE